MKKIILSALMIAVVGVAAVSATGAWFTDQETVSNDFSAGKLNVDLAGAYKDGIVIPLGTEQTFSGGLRPGQENGPYEIRVYNRGHGQSTMPVKYSWRVEYTGGNIDLFNKLNVKVREGNADWLGAAWFEPNSGWLHGDATTWKKLKSMSRIESANSLDVNITRATWFYFQLDSSAGDNLQGQSAQFNLVLDATQPENPGWNQ